MNAEKIRLFGLIGAAVVTIVLCRSLAATKFSTLLQFLLHGFTRWAMDLWPFFSGGKFKRLIIFPNGFGIAYYSGSMFFEPISSVLVASAGPMGPPLAGAGLIIASRKPKASSMILKFLGIFLLFSALVWIRSIFGIVAIVVIGAIVLGISFIKSEGLRNFVVQFLGVQACVATYFQIGYLFSYSAGPLGISDTGRIQQILRCVSGSGAH